MESPTTNDDNLVNQSTFVDSFWPGNRLGKRPILPTVSAENIKIEKKLSRYTKTRQRFRRSRNIEKFIINLPFTCGIVAVDEP